MTSKRARKPRPKPSRRPAASRPEPPAEIAALIARCRNLDDIESHLVLGDWLQTQGDPHGELVMIHHQLEQTGDPRFAQLAAAWMDAHAPPVPGFAFEWRLGFVRAATFSATAHDAAQRLERFLDSPTARLLTALEIKCSAGLSIDEACSVLERRAPPGLKSLSLRGDKLSATSLLSAAYVPELEDLTIRANVLAAMPSLELPRLERLVLHVTSTQPVDIGLDARNLSALRTLLLDVRRIAPAMLRAILGGGLPLRSLGVFMPTGREALMAELVRSSVFSQLEEVGLYWPEPPTVRGRTLLDELLASGATPRVIPSPMWSGAQLYNLGQRLRDAGRVADALRCFELAVHVEPKRADNWLELGNVLDALGRVEQSIASYHKALAIDPGHRSAHYNLAMGYRDRGEPLNALAHITAACKANRDDPHSWHVLGQLHAQLGNVADADQALTNARIRYEDAVRRDDADGDAWFQLACVHQLLDQPTTCLELLARAFARNPALKQEARTDRDLIALRDDPRFVELTS
ncbi:MAG: tetratricopeptide repeat protein [Kofleriaceae bacterium]